MRMRAIKTFIPAGAKQAVRPGDEYEVKDSLAKQDEAHGYAAPVQRPAKPARGGRRKPNKAAAAGPLRAAGGKTGAAAARSSSRAGQAQRKRR